MSKSHSFIVFVVAMSCVGTLYPQPDIVPWDVYQMRLEPSDPNADASCPSGRTLRFGLKTGNLGSNFTRSGNLNHLAEFTIEKLVNGVWQQVSNRKKVTICPIDSAKMCPVTDGSSAQHFCGNNEGINPQWYDDYPPSLSGQWGCMANETTGTFRLKVFSDPDLSVNESNENNNEMTVQFTLNNSVITDVSPPQFSFSNHCFEDSFDDGSDLKPFFSHDQSRTGDRWAVAKNTEGVLCDVLVRTVSGSDKALESKFSGRAGDAGATNTLAVWENAYVPKGSPQTLKIRVQAPSGDLSTSVRRGRIAVAVIGRTGMTRKLCNNSFFYEEQSFGGSTKVGIELETGKPFIFFDPPFSETTFPAISLTNITTIEIIGKYTASDVTLTIKDGAGNPLFSATIGYPAIWNWTGTHAGCIAHWGITPGTSDTLFVKDFVVSLP